MRPGGNPELKEHQYKTTRAEPLTAQMVLKLTESMLQKLKSQKNWQNLVRGAIAEKLEQIDREASLQKNSSS